MTAKELIIHLLDFPDLDTPVIVRGNEINSIDRDIGKVDCESTDLEAQGWLIVLYDGPGALKRQEEEKAFLESDLLF